MSATPLMACTARIDEAIKAHIQGRTEQAESLYRSVLTDVPKHPQASQFLGVLLFQAGRKPEGLEWMERAVEANPRDPEGWSNLGNAYRVMGRGSEAIASLRRAIELVPDFAPAHCTLSACLREAGTLSSSIESARRAVHLQADMPQAHCNLGLALLEAGEIPNAIAAFRQAIYVAPQFLEAHQSLLFAMLYSDQHTAESLYKQAQTFGSTRPGSNWPISGKLTNIAFLSGDFRKHPVSFFLEPVLKSLDNKKYRTFLLSNTPTRDEQTDTLEELAYEFIDVQGMSAHEIQDACKDMEIDMVIDLSGHTAANRMDALSLRLAPVQVSWLGYSGTSGLPTMDWIIGDNIVSPNELNATTERVACLPDSVFCVDPALLCTHRSELPALKNGYVTFGSFNNLSKISPTTLAAWSAVLNQTENSRLIVKSRHLADPAIAARIERAFTSHGVGAERIVIRGWTESTLPLRDYDEIDIALDTFPYSGATTTVDALSMGVPVVTMVGDRYAGRMSASLLTALGRSEWITSDCDSYVAAAVNLASNLESLSAIRRDLPFQLQGSGICDVVQFAQNFENCLEQVWRDSQKHRQIC